MAAFEEGHRGGMAGEIRASITSDQFDLANYTGIVADGNALCIFIADLAALLFLISSCGRRAKSS
jgi:cytidylate kinase